MRLHVSLASLAVAALTGAPLAARAQQAGAPATLQTTSIALVAPDTLALVPMPRELRATGWLSLANGASVTSSANADDAFAARDLTDALRERGVRAASGTARVQIRLERASDAGARAALQRASAPWQSAMDAEGYAIVVDGGVVHVVGANATGVFYGAQTVKQLVDGRGASARLRRVRVRDWPAMKYRGFHDDLSRGPVPTLDFQKKQIRTFAAYKLNVYSPYFEHTLAHSTDPLIGPPGGSITREQALELSAYAKRYHVTIVPEQESFGHLHHMLKYELYNSLGETPHGHVLAPGDPRSVPLVASWFAEMDTLFPSPMLHIGADETFELGRGQTADAVKSRGIGAVYLDFLKRVEVALRPYDKRLLFWGDVAMNHPDLVKTLPKDLVAVAWNYDAQSKGFDRFITPFRDAGMETWVAPGANNWNRVYPNYSVTLPNIQGFVRDGQRLGAVGMLNTSWDDDGEALFAQTWYGVLFGAAASWQPGESSIADFQRRFGVVFHGDTTGRIDEAQRKLIAAYALLRTAGVNDNTDFLFWVDPWTDEGRIAAAKLRPVLAELRTLSEQAIVLAAQARATSPRETEALDALSLGARRLDVIGMKFQFTDEIVQSYARAVRLSDTTSKISPTRDLADITGPNGRFQDLRDAYSLTRDLYEQAWLRENRPYFLHNVLARFDMATQMWIERGDRVNLARAAWYRTKKLPSAAEAGVPTN